MSALRNKGMFRIGLAQIGIWAALGAVLFMGNINVFSKTGLCILALFFALEWNTTAWHKQMYSNLIEEIEDDHKDDSEG